ncbi:hypothetical protein K5D40_02955 [Pseudomonas cichorii]|nr:hypothetical protein [Pseudomonas cichorii]MBX8601191.1 hypothetical protein [Pseudomonas cichorii]
MLAKKACEPADILCLYAEVASKLPPTRLIGVTLWDDWQADGLALFCPSDFPKVSTDVMPAIGSLSRTTWMVAVFSIFFNMLSLVLASRIMNVGLGIIPALLVVAFSQVMGVVLDGTEKLLYALIAIIGLCVYFALLKRFTGESTWTLIKLTIVWMILWVVAVEAFIRIFEVSFGLFLGK